MTVLEQQAGTGATSTENQATEARESAQGHPADICVVGGDDAVENLLAGVLVKKPDAGEAYEAVIEPGRKYYFDFAENQVKGFEQQDGDLRIDFSDGAHIVLKNFAQSVNAEIPASLAFTESLSEDGGFTDLLQLFKSMPAIEALETAEETAQGDLRESGEEIAQADMAGQLAEIEPAAGENGGARGPIGASNSGYGFQSSFDSQNVMPITDVGPISPTELAYDIPTFHDDLYFVPAGTSAAAPTTLKPVLVIEDQIVSEDDSVQLSFYAAPESPAGVMVISVSGIPAGWGVSGPGDYDPSTGVWTFTTKSGDDFSGGPVLHPPADSDVDLLSLHVTVGETDPSNGNTGAAEAEADVIVDAVADVPYLDAGDASGDEGTIIPLNIVTSVNDTDGSEVIEVIKISNLPTWAFLTAGAYDSGENAWLLSPSDLPGLGVVVPDSVSGRFTLDVESVAFEKNTNGTEVDTSNNRASAFDTIVLDINDIPELLRVGQNANDVRGSTVPHLVGGEVGILAGDRGADILVGDAGGSYVQAQTQDYNFVFILDVSGSMGSVDLPNSQINLLKNAVKGLMSDFATYDNGAIKVHIVPFSTEAKPSGTFTLTDTRGLSGVNAYLDAMLSGGMTNYEDPMQEAIEWLTGPGPLGGNAITTTYFISDGEPNRYINAAGKVSSGSVSLVMGEITGKDGTNEAARLKSLSDKVIAIGINTDDSIENLNVIDSQGSALNITDPGELGVVLAHSNPVTRLLPAGNDHLQGGDGDDILFGDVLFTENLAALNNLTTSEGKGWEVFERLEAGESAVNPGWTRADTVAYIRTHAAELAQETVTAQNEVRKGGHDTLQGGAGDDLIFGQEGNDAITGGAGNDVIYGGSGADRFIFKALNDGIDAIKDFDVNAGDFLDLSALLTGYDALNDDIADFVIATENGGNTLISVDADGAGGTAVAVDLALLEGVTGLDLSTSVWV